MKVSIIVPLYKGKKYLKSILDEVNSCVENVVTADVELVLVNDFPDEYIEVDREGHEFEVKIINSSQNHGIHGARVKGLKQCTGDYILFLDQDDKIIPSYISSQLACIGNADAVVCRAIHNKKQHYTDSHVFEEVITKKFMFEKWCPIVSPGQVLIKKIAIPQVWLDNILSVNGADDYFLWLSMMAEDRTFALNQEILFEHVVNGMNVSGNSNQMMDSEQEMIQLLLNKLALSEYEKICLKKLPDSLRKIHIKELDNYKHAYGVMSSWISFLQNGKAPSSFLLKKGIKKVAVYGAGDSGKSIANLLKNSELEVLFFIDRNAKYINLEVPAYTIDEAEDIMEGIIISLERECEEIKRDLRKKFNCPIYQIDEIFNELSHFKVD